MIKDFAKRISAAACVALLVLCSGFMCFAESTNKLTDNASLFTGSEQSQLTEQLESVSLTTGWDVIIYTNYNDVDEDSMEDYCNSYYDNHGYGLGEEKSGVFLTIDMGSRQMHIITKGEAMYYFNDERNDEVLDLVSADLHTGDYYEAAKDFVDYTLKYYNSGKPESGSFSNVELAEKTESPLLYVLKHYGIIFGIVSLGIGALSALGVAKKYKNNGKESIYDLHSNSRTTITDKQDVFVTKHVSVHTVSSSSGGSGSGGGRGGSGGGGSSHGGGGRSF
jgi:uncharacterized protein